PVTVLIACTGTPGATASARPCATAGSSHRSALLSRIAGSTPPARASARYRSSRRGLKFPSRPATRKTTSTFAATTCAATAPPARGAPPPRPGPPGRLPREAARPGQDPVDRAPIRRGPKGHPIADGRPHRLGLVAEPSRERRGDLAGLGVEDEAVAMLDGHAPERFAGRDEALAGAAPTELF